MNISKQHRTALQGKSQSARVIYWLEHINNRITQLEALQYLSVMRLAARIDELKGFYPIVKEMIEVKNQFGEVCHVAEYRIKK